MGTTTINKKLGQLKPDVFKTWFISKFPERESNWEEEYKKVGGVIRKGQEEKK